MGDPSDPTKQTDLFLLNTFHSYFVGGSFLCTNISVTKLAMAKELPKRVFLIKVSAVPKIDSLARQRSCGMKGSIVLDVTACSCDS